MEYFHRVSVLKNEEFYEKVEVKDQAKKLIPDFDTVVAGESKRHTKDKTITIRWYMMFKDKKEVHRKGNLWKLRYGIDVDKKPSQILTKQIPQEIVDVAVQKMEEYSNED